MELHEQPRLLADLLSVETVSLGGRTCPMR